jgi:hypothetical protein
MTKITRKSIFTGIERTFDLPITEQQLREWESGKGLIQLIMPELTPAQREFIMTGATEEEWDTNFNDEEI